MSVDRPDLDALEALEATAWPGPWASVDITGRGWCVALPAVPSERRWSSIPVGAFASKEDSDLIAAARNALPALIAFARSEGARADAAEARAAELTADYDEMWPDGWVLCRERGCLTPKGSPTVHSATYHAVRAGTPEEEPPTP